MENRLNENENILKLTNETNKKLIDEKEKLISVINHLISIIIPYRRRYNQLIDSYRFLKQDLNNFYQIQQIIYSNNLNKFKKTFRIYVITIIAFKRFSVFKKSSSMKIIQTSHFMYEKTILNSFNINFIQNINIDDIFHSLGLQFNKIYPPILKGFISFVFILFSFFFKFYVI